jgi:hypothetical protein
MVKIPDFPLAHPRGLSFIPATMGEKRLDPGRFGIGFGSGRCQTVAQFYGSSQSFFPKPKKAGG